MTYNVWDMVNSVSDTKKNLLEEDVENIKIYEPYLVNKSLSYHNDALMYANEMNKNFFIDKDMQYNFYINILRKRKRFSSWIKKEKVDDLECIKSYYNYSNEKALQALKLLSEDQINFIKKQLDTGGILR
jgi:hypothetical protein